MSSCIGASSRKSFNGVPFLTGASPAKEREFFAKSLDFSEFCGILLLEGVLPRGFDPTTAIILAEGGTPSFILPTL
jgi:hypothetical protein